MSKELVIGSNRHETKVAILEEDQLVEVYFQRGNEYSLAGSIHKGRVTRVLPGMQSAFVDLGLERDTFLYVSDFFEENEDIDTVGDEAPQRPERRDVQRRGGQDRGGDRGSGERTGGRPALEAASDVSKVQAIDGGALATEDLAEIGEADEQPGISVEGGRSEGDSSRGGDRNRRGRRRKPRGRGFPENKYATPSALGAPASEDESNAASAETAGEDLEAPSSSMERLPGERIGGGSGDRPSFDRAYADRSSLERIASPGRFNSGRQRDDRGSRGPSSREHSGRDQSDRDNGSAQRSSAAQPADLTERMTEPTDVIILPGESLAKYRRSSAGPASEAPLESTAPALAAPIHSEAMLSEPGLPETASSDTFDPQPPSAEAADSSAEAAPAGEPTPIPLASVTPESAGVPEGSDPVEMPVDEIAVEDLAAEQEAIRDEAEELEFADRVFSHHELQELPEDEKLADIEIERVDRPAGAVETSGWVGADAEGEPSAESAHREATQHDEFALPYESTATVDMVSPVVAYAEPLTTFEASAPLGFSSEIDAEEGDEDELSVAEPEELTGEAQVGGVPQTANLRDPNVRSSHRGSRRNRRRRGGNRFGAPAGVTEGVGGVAAPAVGMSAGAATALEPVEVRREVMPREATDARPAERAERVMPSISDLLKAGQEIIVQIAKEPLGQKGARITSHIALPGRYVVFMPSVSHLGVSRKVASDEERQRLKQILQKHRAGTTGGFIVRTAGEGVPEEEIAADMNFLYNLWLDIRQKAEKKPAPALLHYDLDIVQRILRDHVTEDYKAIWVDNEDMYEGVVTFMQRFQPSLVNRVKMYTREAPIFDAFNITQELEKALRPKVWLKSGGYIVINQTEALVAIDINTGKYVGKSNRLEDTIVKTNTEAVKEIVRQIRLRDLGGIIVVDFIDMDERKNRQKVMAALEEAMESDKAPYKILQFNDFGLVAITRKRVKQSLERTLCAPCPYCEGAGYVKSVQTTIGEILVEAQKLAKAIDSKDAVLRVHPDVAKVLKASNNKYLEEIEAILKRPVLVAGDPTLHTEKFDLA